MAVGRITFGAMSTTSLRGLQASLARTDQLQTQLSSGKRILKPSDDPAGTVSSMQLRAQKNSSDQYIQGSADAIGRLNQLDSSLSDLSTSLQRVREHLVRSGNAGMASDSKAALASEIGSIKGSVVDVFNAKYLDRPVFGGTTPGGEAINAAGVYVGDDRPVNFRVSDNTVIRGDVSGTAAGADTIPALLTRIADNINTNPAARDQDLKDLDTEIQKVLGALGDVGARTNRLETAKANLESDVVDYGSAISQREEIDLPETIMKLSTQQVAYQAGLQSAAKIIQTSLLDYLR